MLTPIYPIHDLCQNRFAIMPHPKGGADLSENLAAIKARGYNVVVSLLTHQEQMELGLTEEAAICQRMGIVFAHYAIQDELPASEEHTYDFIDQLKTLYQQHKTLLFHCRGGVGRSSMILSLFVSTLGISAEETFRLISISRGEVVPESERQRQYVIRLASNLQKEGVG